MLDDVVQRLSVVQQRNMSEVEGEEEKERQLKMKSERGKRGEWGGRPSLRHTRHATWDAIAVSVTLTDRSLSLPTQSGTAPPPVPPPPSPCRVLMRKNVCSN